MATEQPDNDWKTLLAAAGPYPLEAFAFVKDGLTHTVERVHTAADAMDVGTESGASNPESGSPGDPKARPGEGRSMVGHLQSDARHVSGQQLCMGLRDFAIKRYGMMTPAVLQAWNLRSTDDFGRIVFAMIQHGLMSKTADDTLEDFRSVYDFDEAFARDELIRHVGRS